MLGRVRVAAIAGFIAVGLGGCGGDNPTDGAVRVELNVQGFVPGCVELGVEDAADASRRTDRTLDLADGADGTWVVAVYRQEGWSRDLMITTTAREQSCAGKVVETQTSRVTVTRGEVFAHVVNLIASDQDGDGWVAEPKGTDCDDARGASHPGAPERCEGEDDDCDQAVDEDFALGTTCQSGACTGKVICDVDGGVRCSDAGIPFYPDLDGDRYGRGDAGFVIRCDALPNEAANANDCDDTRATVYLNAPERCDGLDNGCNGGIDEGFSLGQACTTPEGCGGTFACEVDGGARCDAPASSRAYPDSDRDGYGAKDAGSLNVCGAIDAGQSLVSTDCDDRNATVFPGAPERCDTLDNDCGGVIDEGLGLGWCSFQGCSGTQACLPDGGITCTPAGDTTLVYPDEDEDGWGQTAGSTYSCIGVPAGFSTDGGDCDDGYPYTRPAAAEICDERDNDCDGTVDDGNPCPDTYDGAWHPYAINNNDPDGGTDFRTASAFTEWSLWLAGRNAALHRILIGVDNTFNGNCGDAHWFASFANNDSSGYIGGCRPLEACTEGVVARHDAFACATGLVVAPVNRVTGLVKLVDGSGTRIFGVGDDGRTFEWNGTSGGPDALATIPGVNLYDVHAADVNSVYAVGASTSPVQPRIFKLSEASGQWTSVLGSSLAATMVDVRLRGVWVVKPDLVFAVGDKGTVLVFDGENWAKLAFPDTTVNLRSVRAFGRSAAYVVAGAEIYRLTPAGGWDQVWNGGTAQLLLFDVTGIRPDAVWVVGEDGLVMRWPD